jgi:quinol monooxygenase YgiN
MFSRSMTIHGNPEALDDGIAYIRDEAMPQLLAMDGCLGLSMLVDRDSGRSIVSTAWRDAESMQASLSTVRELWDRSTEVMGGLAEIEEWELAVVHHRRPTGPGASSRVTWVRADPSRVDDVLDAGRMALLPQLDELPGFTAVTFLVNRDTGRMVCSFTVDSRSALEDTRATGRALREQFIRHMGVEVTDMAEFDLVVAELRVPETV